MHTLCSKILFYFILTLRVVCSFDVSGVYIPTCFAFNVTWVGESIKWHGWIKWYAVLLTNKYIAGMIFKFRTVRFVIPNFSKKKNVEGKSSMDRYPGVNKLIILKCIWCSCVVCILLTLSSCINHFFMWDVLKLSSCFRLSISLIWRLNVKTAYVSCYHMFVTCPGSFIRLRLLLYISYLQILPQSIFIKNNIVTLKLCMWVDSFARLLAFIFIRILKRKTGELSYPTLFLVLHPQMFIELVTNIKWLDANLTFPLFVRYCH